MICMPAPPPTFCRRVCEMARNDSLAANKHYYANHYCTIRGGTLLSVISGALIRGDVSPGCYAAVVSFA